MCQPLDTSCNHDNDQASHLILIQRVITYADDSTSSTSTGELQPVNETKTTTVCSKELRRRSGGLLTLVTSADSFQPSRPGAASERQNKV